MANRLKDWAQREAEKKRFPDGKGTKMKYVDLSSGDYYEDYRGYRDGQQGYVEDKRNVMRRAGLERMEMHTNEAMRAAMERMGEVEWPPRNEPQPTARETILRRIEEARRGGYEAGMVYWLEKLNEYDTGGAPKVEHRFGEYVKTLPGTVTGTVHKAGHFPTSWMTEAVDRAEASEMCITLTVEREGVLVTAMEADERFDIRVTDWQAMEHSEVNPLIHAIEDCEKKLRMLEKVKAASGHG
jgi:hypothetical protein